MIIEVYHTEKIYKKKDTFWPKSVLFWVKKSNENRIKKSNENGQKNEGFSAVLRTKLLARLIFMYICV